MPPISPRMKHFARLRARLELVASHGERGMALPVALFAMVSSMALAGAAVVATVDVQQGASRDNSTKAAIAAADAGANVARERQSRYGFVLNEHNPCLGEVNGKLGAVQAEEVGGQQWCPRIEGTVGESQYAYRVSPVGLDCGSDELCVVAEGTAGGVTRRIEVTYDRSTLINNEEEKSIFEEAREIEITKIKLKQAERRQEYEKVKELQEKLEKQLQELQEQINAEGFIGRDGIVLSGNADIRVGVGTNGSLEASGNATICGDIRHGVGKTWTKSGNAKQCSGYRVAEANVQLPPVSSFMPKDIATNNSNNRITACTSTNVPVGCQKDSYTGNWKSKPPFNPQTRAITVNANDTLTVGGGDYWVCSITLNGNSQLIMADGARVRFFFDTPEHCGTGNQITLSGNNRIAATGYQPSAGRFEVPGFFLLGSPTVASQVSLSGNFSSTNEMALYGPDTYLNISGNATYKGVMVGREIHMSGNGKVEQDAGFELPPELNPSRVLEEIKKGMEGGETELGPPMTEQEELEELDHLIKTWEETRTTTRNSSAVYFEPNGYFECSGQAGPGQPPNAGC
ncbi:MAG TPA: hypothetical protein VHA54_10305 [Solirubrobacterales bacterium]|nr:hypothetical protein [Solirubrobacterales bacterium]